MWRSANKQVSLLFFSEKSGTDSPTQEISRSRLAWPRNPNRVHSTTGTSILMSYHKAKESNAYDKPSRSRKQLRESGPLSLLYFITCNDQGFISNARDHKKPSKCLPNQSVPQILHATLS